jgi:ribonuclease P/MRP protein subunit POP3
MTPGLGQLEPLLAAVADPPASWMTSIRGVALEPSHVKQLLTTAPKDMKAAKELRAKGRAAAKERRKARRRSSLPHGDAGS